MRSIRTLLRRPTRDTLKVTSPWTMDDAHRHAAAMAAFDALLKRDGGFNGSDEHRDAMRRVGETTVSLDWWFFAASRQIRAQVEG